MSNQRLRLVGNAARQETAEPTAPASSDAKREGSLSDSTSLDDLFKAILGEEVAPAGVPDSAEPLSSDQPVGQSLMPPPPAPVAAPPADKAAARHRQKPGARTSTSVAAASAPITQSPAPSAPIAVAQTTVGASSFENVRSAPEDGRAAFEPEAVPVKSGMPVWVPIAGGALALAVLLVVISRSGRETTAPAAVAAPSANFAQPVAPATGSEPAIAQAAAPSAAAGTPPPPDSLVPPVPPVAAPLTPASTPTATAAPAAPSRGAAVSAATAAATRPNTLPPAAPRQARPAETVATPPTRTAAAPTNAAATSATTPPVSAAPVVAPPAAAAAPVSSPPAVVAAPPAPVPSSPAAATSGNAASAPAADPPASTAAPAAASAQERASTPPAPPAPVAAAAPSSEVRAAGALAPPAVRRTEAVLLQSNRPAYPEFARRSGVGGDVEVEITIDENGRVTRASAVTGPSVLHAAAVTAVLQWRYRPGTENGAPVSTRRRVRLSFQ